MSTFLDDAVDAELVPEVLPVDARISLSADTAHLLALFEKVASVTPLKEAIKKTSQALVEADAGDAGTLPSVRLTATNGSMTASVVSDSISIHLLGSALVPARKVVDVLKLVTTEKVRFEVLGNSLTILAGRSRWTLQTEPGDALPPSADLGGLTTHTLSSAGFLDALTVARKAASTSTARSSLMQILVSSGSLTGLDGGRLHQKTVPGLPQDLAATIPLPVADEIVRLVGASGSATLEFGASETHIVVRVGQDEIKAQRLLTPFPDISSQFLIPSLTNQHKMSVGRQDLLDAIKSVRVASDLEYQAIHLSLTPHKETVDGVTWLLTVSARDKTGNEAKSTMPATWLGPKKPRTFVVNHKNLSEMLGVIKTEKVLFRVGEDTKQVRTALYVEEDANGFTGWVHQMRPGLLV